MTLRRLAPVAVLLVAAAIAAPAAAPAASPTGLIGCSHNLRTRPVVYPLACGDANIGLTKLRWSSFGAGTARATGVLAVNECEPTCVAGTVTHKRVSVVATRVRTVAGKRTYTRILITAISGDAAGRYGVNRYGPYTLEG